MGIWRLVARPQAFTKVLQLLEDEVGVQKEKTFRMRSFGMQQSSFGSLCT